MPRRATDPPMTDNATFEVTSPTRACAGRGATTEFVPKIKAVAIPTDLRARVILMSDLSGKNPGAPISKERTFRAAPYLLRDAVVEAAAVLAALERDRARIRRREPLLAEKRVAHE